MISIRSFRDIIRLLYIYRKAAKLAFISTCIFVVLAAFILPPKFHSEARLLIKPGRETSTLPIEASDRATYISPSTQRDPIIDEEMQLTGNSVARAVAQYYLDNSPTTPPKGLWKTIKHYFKEFTNTVLDYINTGLISVGLAEPQSELDSITNKFQKKFSVSHSSGSSVIELEFTWNDPVVAQKILEKWVATYLDQRAQNLGRKSLYEFYENESKRLAEQINQIKSQISIHLKTIQGVGSRERMEALTAHIDKLSGELDEAKAELVSYENGLNKTSESMQTLPTEVIKEREISLNPTRLDLQLKLNELELQKLDKLKVYKADALPIKEIENNIALLNDKLKQEDVNLQRSQNLAPNELVTSLKKHSLDRKTRISELKALVAEYQQALTRLKSERETLMRIEPELSRLERDLSVNEKSYALYLDSLEKARIDRELDNSRISNIAVIESASFVPGRTFPKSPLLIALAIPLGLVVMALVIYVCFLLDQRIYDGDSIEYRFKVPLWTSIVDRKAFSLNQTVFDASIYRLYSMLPQERLHSTGLNIGITSATSGEGVSYITENFLNILKERGIAVKRYTQQRERANPNEIVLIEASNVLQSPQSLLALKDADICLLVVEARKTKIATLESAISLLNTAFRKIDGVIINKRRYEVPSNLFEAISAPNKD